MATEKETDIKKTLAFLTSILIAFVAIMRWGGSLYAIVRNGDAISQFDFYISIVLIGVFFYWGSRSKRKHSEIREEYKKYVDAQIKAAIADAKLCNVISDLKKI